MELGDYLNSINDNKKDIIVEDDSGQAEKKYPAFIVNKSLSYHLDTILLANEMNQRPFLDNYLQFRFFLNTIRKKKRFSKWFKPEKNDDIAIVREYYDCSSKVAKEYLQLISDEDIKYMKTKLKKGGVLKKGE